MKNIEKNSSLGARGRKILLSLMIMFTIFLTNFVSSGTWDDSVNYDSNSKEYTITNSFGLGSEVGKIKLNTPLDYKVGAGYQKVAEFTIYNGNNEWTKLLGDIELYNILNENNKLSYSETSRDIDYKYKTIVDEDIYTLSCSKITDKNGTIYEGNCERKVTGTRKVEKWTDFSNSLIGKEEITIGIFTTVEIGDKVEWIPNIYGHRLDEWATWTQALNTGIVSYWKLDNDDLTDSLFLNNGTNSGSTNVSGKIISGREFNAANENVTIQDSATLKLSTTDFTINFWSKNTTTDSIGLLGKSAGGAPYGWTIRQGGTNGIFWTGESGSGTCKTGPGTVGDGNWHMITIRRSNTSATGIEIFQDGIVKEACDGSDDYSDTFVMTLGAVIYQPATGSNLDEVGLWNRELTGAEITQLYNSGDGMSYESSFYDITLNYPTTDLNLLNQEVDFGCFVSGRVAFQNVSLYVDGIKNQTNESGINNTFYNFTTTLSFGAHNWTCEAINAAGDTSYKPADQAFNIKSFVTNSETYNNITTEGSYETFVINLTAVTGYQLSSANLIYNGTTYAGILDNSNAPTYIITKNLIIPDINNNVNLTFYWNITLNNGNTDVSTSHNQTVNNLSIDNCTTNTNMLYNFTLRDEENQNFINASDKNSSIEVDFTLYSSDRTTSVLTLSTNYSKIYFGAICLNRNLTSTGRYSLDGEIKYSADDYSTEYYHIQNYTLTNSTGNQTVSLYDLLSADRQVFRIIYKDSTFSPVDNALIYIERKYVNEGVFKTVEVPKTDSYGETVANLVLNDILYKFTVRKNGFLLGTFENIRVICQTPTISECKLELSSFSSSIPINNFTASGDFYYSLPVYNRTSRLTTTTFSILSGAVSTVTLNLSQTDALGTSVCTDTLVSSAGTLSCTTPASIGNGTIIAKLYKDGTLVGTNYLNLQKTPSDLYGGTVALLGIFILLTLIGASLSDSPTYTILFFMVGIILLFALNLVSHNGFIGGSATILFLIIAIILLIIKGSKRQ